MGYDIVDDSNCLLALFEVEVSQDVYRVFLLDYLSFFELEEGEKDPLLVGGAGEIVGNVEFVSVFEAKCIELLLSLLDCEWVLDHGEDLVDVVG